MRNKKLLAVLLALTALFVFAMTAFAAPPDDYVADDFSGWCYYDGENYYYQDGALVTNQWVQDDDGIYYVGAEGCRYENDIFTIGDKLYGFDHNGVLYKSGVFFTNKYNEETDSYEMKWYCASATGALCVNEWEQPNWSYYDDAENTDWYYLGADGVALTGFQNIGNETYYFDEYYATLYIGQWIEVYDEETHMWNIYYARGGDGDGALAKNRWIVDADGDWTYYGSDCVRVEHQATKIGDKWFAFGEQGKMADDGFVELYDYTNDEWNNYYAKEDGSLVVSDWKQHQREWEDSPNWYYFGANGKGYRDGSYKIGSDYYYFYPGGEMASDEFVYADRWDEELEDWVLAGCYRARANGKLYVNTWFFHEDNDEWYYFGAGGKSVSGIQTIGGKKYCFDEYGRMLEDECATVNVNGTIKYFVVDQNGTPYEAQNNKWLNVDGKWYYVQDGAFCNYGVYLIGGKYYAFNGEWAMYENERFGMSTYDEEDNYLGYYYYHAKADGTLAQNETVSIKEYGYTYVYFYGEDFYTPDVYGLYQVGDGYYYLHGNDSSVTTNAIRETGQGVFAFGADGKGTKLATGWYHNTLSEYKDAWGWMFVRDDTLLYGGIYQIGARKYAFDEEGFLLSDRIYYDNVEEVYWLLTKMDANGNGGFVCEEKNVWKTVNGEYVYLDADSTLRVGWLGYKWYMTPYMSYCSFAIDQDGVLCVLNTAGVSKRLFTATGLYNLNGQYIYLNLGVPAREAWRKIDNAWYYFGADCSMYTDGVAKINGVYYYFDANGKMADNGWNRSSDGRWVWAAKSGALFTGKDSAGYVFSSSGELIVDDVYQIDGTWYVTNQDGKAIGSFSGEGWHKVGNNWYYVAAYQYDEDDVEYEVVTGSYHMSDGRLFVFDNQGRMLTNQFYQGEYYLGSNGAAVQGWFKDSAGYWYYGMPDDYGCFCNGGIYTINEQEYAFDSLGRLRQNATFFDYWYDAMITTDINGKVIKQADADGWVYNVDDYWGEGVAYYFKDGKAYNGWLGNRYIDGGYMVVNSAVYDDKLGEYYYIDAKGVKVKSGWYERYEDEWIYVHADGTLAYDEWLKSGNYWYYFDEYRMACNSFYYIDGEWHEFAENGVWLGKEGDTRPDATGKKDGWFKHNGAWYFVMAEKVVYGEELYINGKFYRFDYDGKMATNGFRYSYYTGHDTYRYYTADGSAATYKGWQKIGGEWAYFDAASNVNLGWLSVGGKTYYQAIVNEDYQTDSARIGLLTGYQTIDGVLYQFNDGGVLVKTIKTPGWYKGGSDWYLIDANGNLVRNEYMYKSGNAYYAFDYDGKMIVNDVYGDHYFDASGKMVTKSGWYQVSGGKWVYVLKSGVVARYGVFRINGKDQYFKDGYWLG